MSTSIARVQIGSLPEPIRARAIECLRRFYPDVRICHEGAEIVLEADRPAAQLRSMWFCHVHEASTREARLQHREHLVRELFL